MNRRAVSQRLDYIGAMLSVIVSTEGVEHPAVATLAALVPGAATGLIREVILVDRSGTDAIARVADVAGCAYLASPGGRAEALAAGAARARAPWLMFMRAGAVLEAGWIDETTQFMESVGTGGHSRAAVFRSVRSPYARLNWRERLAMTARLFGMPPAEQGLLIARDHYQRLGGYSTPAKRPEAQFLRRLGRASRIRLRSRIIVA